MARRVEIIGGGPAGAFSARLLALRHPTWRIRLHERLPPDDTFGFGVGLTKRLLDTVRLADEVTHQRLREALFPFSSAEFRLPQGDVSFGNFHSGAIRRAELLRLLLESAVEAGVDVRIGHSADVSDLVGDADLVIGADGLSSTTREKYAEEVGARAKQGRGVFIWCGADIELQGTVFQPVRTPEGTFVAHSYPYAEGLSTFVIETSQQTLERAGFVDREWSRDDESDVEALAYLSAAFAPLLDGAKFFGNRSRWMRFTTLRCASWYHENIVLLGDSAATVHPSLGSGTKVALESAIALADSLDGVDARPLPGALADFERRRRPAVDKLQESARRSQLWWESFTVRQHLSAERIAVAYLSRAGIVSLSDLNGSTPGLATRAAADYAGVTPTEVPEHDLSSWVLARPLTVSGTRIPSRVLPAPDEAEVPTQDRRLRVATIEVDCDDAWGEQGEAYLDRARELVGDGAEVIQLTGSDERSAVMDRLAIAERMRRTLPVPVGVAMDEDQLNLGVDGLVADRTDLVCVQTGS